MFCVATGNTPICLPSTPRNFIANLRNFYINSRLAVSSQRVLSASDLSKIPFRQWTYARRAKGVEWVGSSRFCKSKRPSFKKRRASYLLGGEGAICIFIGLIVAREREQKGGAPRQKVRRSIVRPSWPQGRDEQENLIIIQQEHIKSSRIPCKMRRFKQ